MRVGFVAALSLCTGLPLPASAQSSATPTANRTTPVQQPALPASPADTAQLIGATVFSKDGQLAGAIDDIVGDSAIIGLGGFLGLGEKDVQVPLAAVQLSPSASAPLQWDGHYGGGNPARAVLSMTIQDLVAAPFYHASGPQAPGAPATTSGTPDKAPSAEAPGGQPPSSTQSGGPG